MDDKTLLLLAAKAAGLKNFQYAESVIGKWNIYHGDPDDPRDCWNPLHDDADAFMLACHLCMTVTTGPCRASASTIQGALRGSFPQHDTIHYETKRAVRWVIVRAAAEIGENMP